MDESGTAQIGPKVYHLPWTDISQDYWKFRIRFDSPGRRLPDHDDRGYGPLAMVVESFMDPGTLIRTYQHREAETIS